MAKSHSSRATRRLTVPEGMDNHTLTSVIENDPTYVDNLRAALGRRSQGKISRRQFWSIRRDLIHRSLYRHVRELKLPALLVPRLEAMVR